MVNSSAPAGAHDIYTLVSGGGALLATG